MLRKLDKILIIDLEATCWEHPNSKPINEQSEVIEIGIALVDNSSLSITANDSILIKPQKSTISQFCTQLTTLTQEQVNNGMLFRDACHKLETSYNSKNLTWASWGDYDRNMMQNQCKDLNLLYPLGIRHLNLKNLFSLSYNLSKELSLDKALDYLNIPLQGTHHRGIDDAKNIANIYIHLMKKFRNS